MTEQLIMQEYNQAFAEFQAKTIKREGNVVYHCGTKEDLKIIIDKIKLRKKQT